MTGCSDYSKDKDSNSTKIDTIPSNVIEKNAEEIKNCKQTIVRFLHWYKENYDTISTIRMIDIADTEEGLYSLNVGKVEAFLKKIQSSELVSQSYINNMRIYIMENGRKMEAMKQKDGPPVGMEADLILLTQEAEETLKNINNIKVVDATVDLNDIYILVIENIYKLKFSLNKNKEQYLIDDISIPNKN